MGSNASKIDGDYLSQINCSDASDIFYNPLEMNEFDTNNPDPRSPSTNRTPINKKPPAQGTPSIQESNISHPNMGTFSDNPTSILKRKFLKHFNYKNFDPRSPTSNFNRTPLVFSDMETESSVGENDGSFNIDDSFSNLFIDNKQEKNETPKDYKKEITDLDVQDPRSPSFGVMRTPILLLNETDKTNSTDNLIEFGNEEKNNTKQEDIEESSAIVIPNDDNTSKKPTEDVINSVGGFKRKSRIDTIQMIYEDEVQIYSTPKTPAPLNEKNILKRTPLSCVANKSHLRSKSVENAVKSKKPKFPLKSYDDQSVQNGINHDYGNAENIANNVH